MSPHSAHPQRRSQPEPGTAVVDLSGAVAVIDLRNRGSLGRRRHVEIPAGVIEMINLAPALRPERMAAARRVLAEGFMPTAEELADEIVRELAGYSWY